MPPDILYLPNGRDSEILSERLRWAGYMLRRQSEEILRKVLTEQMNGTRQVGRPRLRLEKSLAAPIPETSLDTKVAR